MSFDLYHITGLCGVGLGLYAYARVQWQRDFAKRIEYSLLNLGNAALLLLSLSKEWNLPAVISNIIWAGISLYGLYRCFKYERKKKSMPPEDRTRTSAPSLFEEIP